MRRVRTALLIAFAAISLGVLLPQIASAGTVTLRPNGDPATKIWAPSTGSANWSIVNRTDQGTGTYICRANATASDLYDLTTSPIYQGATAMTVRVYTFMGSALLLSGSSVTLNADINGTLVGATSAQTPPSTLGLLNNCTGTGGSYEWRSVTYNGSWSQSQIDSLKMLIGRQNALFDGPIRISQAEVQITYADPPTLNQSAYRVYQNTNTAAPGSPLAANNTTAELPTKNAPFRIRMGATVTGEWWRANYGSNKLQFTAKNQSTCAASTGWADVTTNSGAIRWNDNSAVADASVLTPSGNDPSGVNVAQQYRETNDFITPSDTPLNSNALWDFSLRDAAAVPGTTYCFRMVNVSGSIPITYSQYPEVLAVGDLTVDIVNASGVPVANPAVQLSTIIALPQCQQSTGTLGFSTQRLRITNDLVKNGWSASIAATNGQTALWSNGGSLKYDFNDPTGSPPGCTSGLDGDAFAGQLKIRPSSSSVAPKAGCTTTGGSLGADNAFNSGIVDSITLVNASSTSQRFCYWDITGIGLEQQIPDRQPIGTYTLDLTVTVVAS